MAPTNKRWLPLLTLCLHIGLRPEHVVACVTEQQCRQSYQAQTNISGDFYVGTFPTYGCFSKNNNIFFGTGGTIDEMRDTALPPAQKRIWCDTPTNNPTAKQDTDAPTKTLRLILPQPTTKPTPTPAEPSPPGPETGRSEMPVTYKPSNQPMSKPATNSPLPVSKPVATSLTSKPTIESLVPSPATVVNKSVPLATPSPSFSTSTSSLPTMPSTTSFPASVVEKISLTIPPTYYSNISSLSLPPTTPPSARHLTAPVSDAPPLKSSNSTGPPPASFLEPSDSPWINDVNKTKDAIGKESKHVTDQVVGPIANPVNVSLSKQPTPKTATDSPTKKPTQNQVVNVQEEPTTGLLTPWPTEPTMEGSVIGNHVIPTANPADYGLSKSPTLKPAAPTSAPIEAPISSVAETDIASPPQREERGESAENSLIGSGSTDRDEEESAPTPASSEHTMRDTSKDDGSLVEHGSLVPTPETSAQSMLVVDTIVSRTLSPTSTPTEAPFNGPEETEGESVENYLVGSGSTDREEEDSRFARSRWVVVGTCLGMLLLVVVYVAFSVRQQRTLETRTNAEELNHEDDTYVVQNNAV